MSFVNAFSTALAEAKSTHQRRLLVLTGERRWCIQQLEAALPQISPPFSRPLWLGDIATFSDTVESHGTAELSEREALNRLSNQIGFEIVKPTKANGWLGITTDFVVADLWSGFHPDALTAITGTLGGGGLLILLTPDFTDWPHFSDPDYQRMLVYPQTADSINGRFIRWVIQTLYADLSATQISQQLGIEVKPQSPLISDSIEHGEYEHHESAITAQSQLVSELIAAVGRQQPVMVVKGDRGRGKSAGLGILAAALMQQSTSKRICVTAPKPEAVHSLFAFAKQYLPENTDGGELQLSYGSIAGQGQEKSQLAFIAPDELIRSQLPADVLIVDEAAAIPVFMLEQLLEYYPQVIFATTVHGYEGTGRGFDLRFAKVLDQRVPGWQSWWLTDPIRWAKHDPLEHWLNQAFLLDLEVEALHSLTSEDLAYSKIHPLSQDQLLDDSGLLKQVYGLLIQAHYRTTPGDLRDLLDGNLRLWVQSIELDGHLTIIGVLLLASEGELPEELSQDIWAGKRRPRGHLVPQYLTAQAGFLEAAQYRYLRVVRIAVHPDLQSKGLGSQLLAALDQIAEDENAQVIGAMFAASADLMRFWRQNGYQALRLGVSRDSSSGSYTALVAKVIDRELSPLFEEIELDFLEQLQAQLMNVWQDLEPSLLIEMITDTSSLTLTPKAFKDVESYLFAYRGLDQIRSLIARYLFCVLQKGELSEFEAREVLISYLLQNKSLSETVKAANVTGQKQWQQLIKTTLQPTLQRFSHKG